MLSIQGSQISSSYWWLLKRNIPGKALNTLCSLFESQYRNGWLPCRLIMLEFCLARNIFCSLKACWDREASQCMKMADLSSIDARQNRSCSQRHSDNPSEEAATEFKKDYFKNKYWRRCYRFTKTLLLMSGLIHISLVEGKVSFEFSTRIRTSWFKWIKAQELKWLIQFVLLHFLVKFDPKGSETDEARFRMSQLFNSW